jgi:hypothetical protein
MSAIIERIAMQKEVDKLASKIVERYQQRVASVTDDEANGIKGVVLINDSSWG